MTSLLIFFFGFFWFVELVLRHVNLLLHQTESFCLKEKDLVVHYIPSIGCKQVQY